MEYVFSAIITFAVGMLSWALQALLKENHKLKKAAEDQQELEQTAIKEAIVCILRDRLIDMHKKYTSQGFISIHGLQNWKAMYKAYTTLGGNGMIVHMNNDIEELPIQ